MEAGSVLLRSREDAAIMRAPLETTGFRRDSQLYIHVAPERDEARAAAVYSSHKDCQIRLCASTRFLPILQSTVMPINHGRTVHSMYLPHFTATSPLRVVADVQ